MCSSFKARGTSPSPSSPTSTSVLRIAGLEPSPSPFVGRCHAAPTLPLLPLAHPLSRLLLSRLLCVCLQVAFAYTTAITASDDGVLVALSAALAQRLKFGCIVVTTDYTLDPSAFELLEAIEGENTGVGGRSTGFIHRKICAGERDDEDAAAAYVPPPPTSDELSAAADFHAMELLLLHNLEADSRNRSAPQ